MLFSLSRSPFQQPHFAPRARFPLSSMKNDEKYGKKESKLRAMQSLLLSAPRLFGRSHSPLCFSSFSPFLAASAQVACEMKCVQLEFARRGGVRRRSTMRPDDIQPLRLKDESTSRAPGRPRCRAVNRFEQMLYLSSCRAPPRSELIASVQRSRQRLHCRLMLVICFHFDLFESRRTPCEYKGAEDGEHKMYKIDNNRLYPDEHWANSKLSRASQRTQSLSK